MKILVVEDNEISSKLMSTVLNKAGFTVDVASTGGAAIKLYAKNNYDFIFMDVGLPDCDGTTVTRHIRKRSARKKHIPIIALTAHGDEQTKKACLTAGMNDFLTKPIDNKQLKTIVTKYATTPCLPPNIWHKH